MSPEEQWYNQSLLTTLNSENHNENHTSKVLTIRRNKEKTTAGE